MKKPKLRELKEALRSLFSRPFTSFYPFTAHRPADGFRGKPIFHIEDCIGCAACSEVCPSGAISCTDNREHRTRLLSHDAGRCIFCGKCEEACITNPKGIRLSKEFNLAYLKGGNCQHSISHTLLLCDSCGEVIGTTRHLEWVSHRLGPLSFGSGLLLGVRQAANNIPKGIEEVKVKEPYDRVDILKNLCPKCRRSAFLADEKV
jgi:formate hydrogenlyase subunit 6/NADH:ubiquinone oxidoreductase subunit I